ncbi:putative bifunctional diguanylate cyclase/phosphodiesterase [Noviherbaspirillum saxi]|uniref:EAL domain-containing protein n=1 Tax=Noviherbaspirillum saxi TaxID=2320863 RepID=A0A3A3FLM8_9BURK|nr:EAL domain-containing protein [Noviherbaspirillum saxi]RJF95631.1 EAL domain-containing protein [Noviherbaspirillum saxi]
MNTLDNTENPENGKPYSEAELRQTLLEYQAILDNASVGIVFTRDRKILRCNDRFSELFGWPKDHLVGMPTIIVYPSAEAFDEMGRIAIPVLSRGERLDTEVLLKRRDGSTFWGRLRGKAIDPADVHNGTIFILEDITEHRMAQERLLYMAHYDALTGLPNRTLLQDRIKQALSHAQRDQSQVVVMFIDLDYFKHVNDSLGHQVGDRLLQTVAIRLQKCLREGDSLARLGGDEFVLSLPVQNGSDDAALVAKKVLDTLDQAFIADGHELHMSASIGISLYPNDGTDAESLMRAADTAMYDAKEKGRNNYQFFTPALNTTAQRHLTVANRLRQALAHDEFALYYQPQVDMESGTILSAEALLRCLQPGDKAPISFGAFITIAEKTGLILPIGDWVLRQACLQLKQWRDLGYADLRIAVNLSPRQFHQPHLLATIEQILGETGLPANALDLEITESVLLQRSEDNLDTLQQLNDMGLQLSIDDFGTGYSSLAYLQRFPVHALKIDQTFVRGINQNLNDTALVTAIIAMAQSLHLEVLAEGVETEQQASFLMSHGCRAAQGFYYGEAVPAKTFTRLLRRQTAHMPGVQDSNVRRK